MNPLRVGDLVEVFDTDGWGFEGAWLRGTVYQLLPRSRYRVACVGGGMTDVSPDQIRPCTPAQAPLAA
jgi:agenet domain-containing protein